MTDSDTRGILTEVDEKWLKDEIEYEQRQTAAKRRRQIRERVALALQDFQTLSEHWSSEESQKMLEDLDSPEQSASEIIEFLYILFNEPATDANQMVEEKGTEQPLAFRRALRNGIVAAKEHFGDAPNDVLIDASTDLFELPTADDLRGELDTDQWRGANDYTRGAANTQDDAVIDKEDAAQDYYIQLVSEIQHELFLRRQRPDVDIDRHDQLVKPLGVRPRDED